MEALGKHGPSDYLKAWRSIAKQYGEEALLTRRKGRPVGRKASLKSEVDLKTRIAYLEAENDFLKQLKTNTNFPGLPKDSKSSKEH